MFLEIITRKRRHLKSKKTSMAMGSQDSALFAGTWNRTAIAEGLKRKVLRPYLAKARAICAGFLY